MAVVGLWIATAGYGLVYAGYVKLAGGQCGVIQAFRGKCTGAQVASSTSGQTQRGQLLAQQRQQASMIGTQPISQGAA